MATKTNGASPGKRHKYDIAYYHAERQHSSLGYQAPNHFEIRFQTMSQPCPA